MTDRDLPAGSFSSWLRRTHRATQGGADVPCGGCTACCRSSYFIHIGPEETKTLSRIPGELLFAAPGRPVGNVVLGYDEKGHCPMLIDDQCSIYEDRPSSCRSYDCRILPAAGMTAGDDKVLINERIRRWKFTYPSERDRKEHSATRAAAIFLRQRAECFPAGFVPANPTQLATLAIKVSDVFLDQEPGTRPDLELAEAVIEASERFES